MNKNLIFGFLILLIIYFFINKLSKNTIENYNNIEKWNFLPNNNLKPIKNINNSDIEMKKYNIIFGGTVRNVESYIKTNLDHIDNCGKKFNNYYVIIYENDSHDNTRNILLQNKKSNYEYIFEDNITEARRTVRISNGRNKILEKVRQLNINNNYNYFVMLDLDDVNVSGNFVDSINTCFEYSNWDILTGNQSSAYYDLWALRKKDDMEYDCWRVVSKNPDMHKDIFVYFNYQPGELLEVDSAFGGIAIYKLSSIPENCNYVGKYDDETELCEHVEFNKCIKNSGKSIYINTSFLTN